MFKNKILKALEGADLTGFTISLVGDLKRYVVANTHNKSNVDIDTLTQQAEILSLAYSNINVGGWRDEQTNEIYLDISTSFDSLKNAIQFAKETKQLAIWDNVEFKEIRI